MEYPTLDPEKIGRRIRKLRKQKHIKIREISEYMGFGSDQAVYKWQQGVSLPTVDNLFALSKLLDTTVDYILQGEQEEDEGASSYLLQTYKPKPPVDVFCIKNMI